jgi:hypothetical protein
MNHPISANVGVAPSASAMVSVLVRLPVSRLQEHMSAIAKIGASATVNLRGSPEHVVSFITSLAGRYPAISAQVSVGKANSAVTSISGKSPVK